MLMLCTRKHGLIFMTIWTLLIPTGELLSCGELNIRTNWKIDWVTDKAQLFSYGILKVDVLI